MESGIKHMSLVYKGRWHSSDCLHIQWVRPETMKMLVSSELLFYWWKHHAWPVPLCCPPYRLIIPTILAYWWTKPEPVSLLLLLSLPLFLGHKVEQDLSAHALPIRTNEFELPQLQPWLHLPLQAYPQPQPRPQLSFQNRAHSGFTSRSWSSGILLT